MGRIVKESSIRAMVKILLEDSTLGPALLKVNPVVDPSAAVTDPANQDFVPVSPAEFKVALSAIVDDVPQDNIPDIYKSIKHALSAAGEDEGKEEMNKKDTKVEEAVRKVIRKMIKEGSYADLASTGLGGHISSGGGDDEKKLKDIAAAAGFSGESGVENMIGRLLPRLKSRLLDMDKVKIIALETMVKHINDLVKSKRITPEEAEMWRKHPEVVENDNEFRDKLNKALIKAGM